MEKIEDLFELIKTIPEEGKIEFLAVWNEFQNHGITIEKTIEMIDFILEKYKPKYLN